jgi:hypothetical protein
MYTNKLLFGLENSQRGKSISYGGRPVKIVKSYNSDEELTNDLDFIESISGNTGLSGGAQALIHHRFKHNKLPFHLIKNSKGEYEVCYNSDLYNSDEDF